MDEPNLKPQFKLVAQYYCGVAQGNAEKAVVMAGYSQRYARGNAYKLIARKDVQEYIKYINSRAEGSLIKHIATIEEIQDFWTQVMSNGENSIKDRLRASELLAKSKGAFISEF